MKTTGQYFPRYMSQEFQLFLYYSKYNCLLLSFHEISYSSLGKLPGKHSTTVGLILGSSSELCLCFKQNCPVSSYYVYLVESLFLFKCDIKFMRYIFRRDLKQFSVNEISILFDFDVTNLYVAFWAVHFANVYILCLLKICYYSFLPYSFTILWEVLVLCYQHGAILKSFSITCWIACSIRIQFINVVSQWEPQYNDLDPDLYNPSKQS